MREFVKNKNKKKSWSDNLLLANSFNVSMYYLCKMIEITHSILVYIIIGFISLKTEFFKLTCMKLGFRRIFLYRNIFRR